MEGPIQQNARPLNKLFAVYLPISAAVTSAALVGFLYSTGHRNTEFLLVNGVMIFLAVVVTLGGFGLSMRSLTRVQWSVGKDGLTRTVPGRPALLIPWEQILAIKFSGLLAVQWTDGQISPAAIRRGYLLVDRRVAEDLIREWKAHRSGARRA